MAPSARANRRNQSKQQPTLSNFNRVSKSVVITKADRQKGTTAKQLALEKLENEKKPARPTTAPKEAPKKRKRDLSDIENDEDDKIKSDSSSKRTKIQLPTPPRTPIQRSSLSSNAQELISMFTAFCKAFALHRAHNGPGSPAELTALLESVTRLYQKRSVTITDLQRILAVLEEGSSDIKQDGSVQRKLGPFKLSIIGSGLSRRRVVEYVGCGTSQQQRSKFDDQQLQIDFERAIRKSFISTNDGPLLEFELGVQTAARQAKTSDTMKHIMAGRKDLSMEKLSISDSNDASGEIKTIKSRTMSLFDRVKAKQLANSAINTPSADALRRKHAVARMAEVVEILRMKQQQKLRGYQGAGSSGKVSFAMRQIVSELKVSMAIPMADDEIKLCLEILSTEISGGWCSIFELGVTRSVVLTGTGRSGQELAKMVEP